MDLIEFRPYPALQSDMHQSLSLLDIITYELLVHLQSHLSQM